MRKYMIFYYENTGRITNKLLFDQAQCEKMMALNPGLTCMEAPATLDIAKHRVNVSTTPHSIELIPPTPVNVQNYIREQRSKILKWCDWTQTEDSPLSPAKKAEWAAYRQALRDMPSTYADTTTLADVVWPTRPN